MNVGQYLVRLLIRLHHSSPHCEQHGIWPISDTLIATTSPTFLDALRTDQQDTTALSDLTSLTHQRVCVRWATYAREICGVKREQLLLTAAAVRSDSLMLWQLPASRTSPALRTYLETAACLLDREVPLVRSAIAKLAKQAQAAWLATVFSEVVTALANNTQPSFQSCEISLDKLAYATGIDIKIIIDWAVLRKVTLLPSSVYKHRVILKW
jgi:hypothetical protein